MVRKRRRNSQPDVYFACAVLLCAPCLLLWVLISPLSYDASRGLARVVPAQGMARTADHHNTATVRPAALRMPRRAIYPHSVIPGGAYSVTELQAALRVDPVAAAHYAVFDRSQMRIERASDSAAVYVSYRQGDRVYWTRRKMQLASEEWLLTDGVHAARSRCGNRISLTPQEPTATSEPAAIELDLPEPPSVADPADPDPDDGSADDPDLFPLPMMVVHEIFPALLGDVAIAGLPADSSGWPMLVLGPVGVRFSGPPQVAPPLLSGLTLPPRPVVWPIDFHLPPPQPVGPGFVGVQPIPLPVIYEPGGTLPPAPPVWSLPTLPGGPPLPRPPGLLPPGLTVAGGPPSLVPLPPNDPQPFSSEIPEPATAALLLCGAVVLAVRRLSGRS